MPRAACECCEWLGSVLLSSPSRRFEKGRLSLFQSLLGSLRKQKAQVCCRPHYHHQLLLLFPFVLAGD